MGWVGRRNTGVIKFLHGQKGGHPIFHNTERGGGSGNKCSLAQFYLVE